MDQSYCRPGQLSVECVESMGVLIVMYLKIVIKSIWRLKFHAYHSVSNYGLVGGGVDDMFLFLNNVTAAIFQFYVALCLHTIFSFSPLDAKPSQLLSFNGK